MQSVHSCFGMLLQLQSEARPAAQAAVRGWIRPGSLQPTHGPSERSNLCSWCLPRRALVCCAGSLDQLLFTAWNWDLT